jgi:ATP-dependent Clp protease ATP-binding subunit ClpA
MFERFTTEARAVVDRAVSEAGADRVRAEHLLLGVAAVDGRVLAGLGLGVDALRAELARLDADALAAIGIDRGEVERRAEASFGPGALRGSGRGRPRFEAPAKRALELSLREALALDDRRIGAEHVLLGLMREPAPRVRAVLAARGVDAEAVRAAVLAARARAA